MSRVLIADDEESMRTLVARAIAMDGHEIVTAQDGAEALDILTRENGAFDLLLTDIQMPIMDGIALALSAALEAEGIRVGAIRPPTVPAGTARLRITLSASHSAADVTRLLEAIARAVPQLHKEAA